MTTVWDIPADNLYAHLGRNGEYWIKGQYNDGSSQMCLHGAIRMCDLKPGDAYVIEQVANDQGWGPSWNDSLRTNWSDIVARIGDSITITDDMLADTFGPNWATILEFVRNIATVTAQQADDAADLDDGRYDEPNRLLQDWRETHLYSMCRSHKIPLLDWTAPAREVVRTVTADILSGHGQMQVAFTRIAEILACRHLILKDGYDLWYLNVTAQARDLFGPLHPDDPT